MGVWRPVLAAKRNTQLDGWRAFAVVGVMWHHWAPREWRGPLPFEIGLFFFLTLTGFLITRILLREKAAGESAGGSWKRRAYRGFLHRRFARILVPCYVAMAFAMICGAADIRAHPLPYFAHVSNFHMAWMDGWPSGTAHYWTLAIQMQFYLLWPLLVLPLPRRWLGWGFGVCLLAAPASRFVIGRWFPEIHHGEAITSSALDYFGAGALLALALERGLRAGDRRLAACGWAAFAVYAALYIMNEVGNPVPVLCHFQQTFLAIGFAALISSTLGGLAGPIGRVLEHGLVQQVGRLSYGLYLFHTPVPLFLGWVLPWLWTMEIFNGPLLVVRLAVFAVVSLIAARLCWRWLEGPDRLRFKWSPGDH